jgi:hypothetical protein
MRSTLPRGARGTRDAWLAGMANTPGRGAETARPWRALWPLALALVLAIVWVWHNAAVKQEAENRRRDELYRRTLENVQSVCRAPEPGLESYCRAQAALLLEYPECDPDCVALAREVRGEPAR